MNRLTIPIANGSDPEVIDIEDRGSPSLAYGEDFPEIDTPCDYSPTGQCEYGGPNDRECKWCRKPSGLDQ